MIVEFEALRNGPASIESPALYGSPLEMPAFEVKFVLSEEQARAVENRLCQQMSLDPHADPSLGNAYRITSIYFDTPGFDVYRRQPGHRARKYRVRRYGSSPVAFLERKSKNGQRVRKRRVAIPLEEVNHVFGAPSEDWPGHWFTRQVAKRALRPVCRVTYERTAYVAAGPTGPIRLTFDRAARGLIADGLPLDLFHDGRPLLNDVVIVEFKFLSAMPVLFKEAIEDVRLTPQSSSKYRRCVDAVGLLPQRTTAYA